MGCATAVVAWWCLARVARWPFKFKKSKNEHSEGDKSDKADSSLCAFGVNASA